MHTYVDTYVRIYIHGDNREVRKEDRKTEKAGDTHTHIQTCT